MTTRQPHTISYRTAAESDSADILRVIKTAFAEYEGKLDPPSSAHRKTIEAVREELASATALLAESTTEIVGCVFYQPKEDYMYLYRLSVLPAWRKRGIAANLINLVEQQAVQEHFHAVRLSVRIGLRENQLYYARKGYTFKQYGTHDGYEHPTYLVFEKRLTP